MLRKSLVLMSLISLNLASAAWSEGLRADLVHKMLDEGHDYSHYIGWVQITLPDGKVKVLPHRTHLQPVVAGDRAYIFPSCRGTGGKINEIIVYDARSDKEQSFPVPPDMWPFNASFSPDGKRLAYYVIEGRTGDDPGRVRVRSWPGGKIIWEGPLAPVRATCVQPHPPVWKGSDWVEFDPRFFDPPRFFVFQGAP